jgi:hypothetical protein
MEHSQVTYEPMKGGLGDRLKLADLRALLSPYILDPTSCKETSMRNSKTCQKCGATDIVRIPIMRGRGGYNWIFLGVMGAVTGVAVTRYLCASCGFIEEWIDSADDIAKLKEKYSSRPSMLQPLGAPIIANSFLRQEHRIVR